MSCSNKARCRVLCVITARERDLHDNILKSNVLISLIADDLYVACDEFTRTASQFAARANTINRRKYAAICFSLLILRVI